MMIFMQHGIAIALVSIVKKTVFIIAHPCRDTPREIEERNCVQSYADFK